VCLSLALFEPPLFLIPYLNTRELADFGEDSGKLFLRIGKLFNDGSRNLACSLVTVSFLK
jgi:hypothetical protein